MDELQHLQTQREHCLLSAKDMVERAEKAERSLNDEELKAIGQWEQQADEFDTKIKSLEKHIEAKRSVEAKLAANKAAPKRDIDPAIRAASDDEPANSGIEFYRVGPIKAFKDEFAAYKSGQWIRAVFGGDQRAQRWCKDRGMFNQVESRANMVTNVNTLGGALVPDEFERAIIDLRNEYGVFRRNTKVVAMGSDLVNIPRRAGGLTAYFPGEGVAITSSNKTWNTVTLTARKMGCLAYMSTELNEDAIINLADDMAQEIAYAFAVKEDECGFNGDGTSTYDGIEGIVNKMETGTTLAGYVNAGTGIDSLNEVTAASLATLMGKLPSYARRGAKFYCSPAAHSIIFERLAVSAGGVTMSELNNMWTPAYLGYPIEVTETMFSTTTAAAANNKVMLLFGRLDLASTMGSRRGVTLRVSEENKFEEDLISIKGTQRIDINVHDVGDTSTAGPIVALIGET